MIKNVDKWIGSYFRQEMQSLFKDKTLKRPTHVMFCFVDHFEPDWNNADAKKQQERVAAWTNQYPDIAQKHKDADGRHPAHTFFYPVEVYNKEHLANLAKLCDQGFGEVEIHLHHDCDTQESFKNKLKQAKIDLARHGLLGQDKEIGAIRYGFIHGNWALNNSRPDGRWCGVNNETTILKEDGCYADFTYPSAPSETQTKKINSIYYDVNNNGQPKSHETGADSAVGKSNDQNLLIVQGPLTLNWKNRKFGIIPRIENSDVTGVNPPTSTRINLWVNQHISIKGRPDWIFVKVHTHGAIEKNANTLLGGSLDQLFHNLEEKCNDGINYKLHYVSAREMYNIIKAAERGETGEPGEYRNYLIVKGTKGARI